MSQQSLQEQIDNLKVLLQQKDEQITQLRKDLNTVFQLCRFGDKLDTDERLFIPEGKEWEIKSPTEVILNSSDNKVRVITSSTWENADRWNPKWLFNGKMEISGQQNGWASGKGLPATLEIHFEFPVAANFLTITTYLDTREQPASFEIYGGNDYLHTQKLGEFTNVTWQISQKQNFSFANDTPFLVYKINFLTSSNLEHNLVSFTKFNLGKIDIHNENNQ